MTRPATLNRDELIDALKWAGMSHDPVYVEGPREHTGSLYITGARAAQDSAGTFIVVTVEEGADAK